MQVFLQFYFSIIKCTTKGKKRTRNKERDERNAKEREQKAIINKKALQGNKRRKKPYKK